MTNDAVEMRLKGEILLARIERALSFASAAISGAGLYTNKTSGGLKGEQVVQVKPRKAPSCIFTARGRPCHEGL